MAVEADYEIRMVRALLSACTFNEYVDSVNPYLFQRAVLIGWFILAFQSVVIC